MSLRDQINDDLKTAMRSGDARRRDALRLLLAAMKQKEVDERKTLADGDVLAIVERLIKQRRESVAQFEQGGRHDLAEHENFELSVLLAYMPQQLSDEDVASEIASAIAGAGAKAPSDMGKVMAILKPKLAGRADMAKVSARVKSRLSGSA
jgi:uncharacterized protein